MPRGHLLDIAGEKLPVIDWVAERRRQRLEPPLVPRQLRRPLARAQAYQRTQFADPKIREMAQIAHRVGATAAADPAFTNVVNNGHAELTAAETNLRVPTQSVLVLTAGANGTKIEELDAISIATSLTPATAAGALLYFFITNPTGPVYYLFDVATVTVQTATTVSSPWRMSPRTYPNLWIDASWQLRASMSVVPTTGSILVHAFGANF